MDGKNIDHVEVENIVQHLTENKLVEIYKADYNVNIHKRKVSPTAATPSSKSGRVNQQLQRTRTIDYYFGNDSSPQLRGGEELFRPRCSTGVTPRKRVARRCCLSLAAVDPKQKLLKNVWKDLINKCGGTGKSNNQNPGGPAHENKDVSSNSVDQ